jgi:glutaryl-CoA dehydrogenase
MRRLSVSRTSRCEEGEERTVVDVSRALGTDYYVIEELLTDEECEIRDRVHALCEEEVIPVIGEY